MDARRFDSLIRSHGATFSRRPVLGLAFSGAVTSLLALTDAEAKKKRKKKKKKKPAPLPPPLAPPPPPPPPPPVCAGKNWCVDDTECGANGADCICWVRSDNGQSFCGTFGTPANDCDDCGGNICVTGEDVGCEEWPFRCVAPCPNPL